MKVFQNFADDGTALTIDELNAKFRAVEPDWKFALCYGWKGKLGLTPFRVEPTLKVIVASDFLQTANDFFGFLVTTAKIQVLWKSSAAKGFIAKRDFFSGLLAKPDLDASDTCELDRFIDSHWVPRLSWWAKERAFQRNKYTSEAKAIESDTHKLVKAIEAFRDSHRFHDCYAKRDGGANEESMALRDEANELHSDIVPHKIQNTMLTNFNENSVWISCANWRQRYKSIMKQFVAMEFNFYPEKANH